MIFQARQRNSNPWSLCAQRCALNVYLNFKYLHKFSFAIKFMTNDIYINFFYVDKMSESQTIKKAWKISEFSRGKILFDILSFSFAFFCFHWVNWNFFLSSEENEKLCWSNFDHWIKYLMCVGRKSWRENEKCFLCKSLLFDLARESLR